MPENQPPPTWIEPPPPREDGMGCFAKGCLITVIALALIFCCLIVVGFFGVRYARETYLSKEPSPIPVTPATPEEVQTLKQQWKEFKHTSTRNESLPPAERQPGHLELTATQINQLISSGKGRGHVSVAINNGVMQIAFSVSMDAMRKAHMDLFGLSGHYANGTVSVTTNGPTTPSSVSLENAELNGHSVSTSLLEQSYRGESWRSYAAKYASENSINTFQIVGDKVVLDTPANQ